MKKDRVDLFRSEKMAFCQLFFETHTAYYYVREFGELGVVHFIDLNDKLPTNRRKFIRNVIWCDDLERKLRTIEEQLLKENRTPVSVNVKDISAPDPRDFVKLENEVTEVATLLTNSTNNMRDLKTSYNRLIECKQMMRVLENFLQSDGISATQLTSKQFNADANLNFVTGTIENSDLGFFEQILWRTSKGNVLMRHTDLGQALIDYETNKPVYKSAFIVFVQGDILLAKVKKICEAIKVSTFSYSCDADERNQLVLGLSTRLSDMEAVINRALSQREAIFTTICENYYYWKIKTLKIKNIYATMNLFSYDSKSVGLVAEGWVPEKDVSSFKETIRIAMETCNSNVPVVFNPVKTNEQPPTYFQVNKFEQPFQEIVDSYGVASYREANPALFTIISFPFLFSIMFSDSCHGIMLTMIGLWLIFDKKFISKYKDSEMFGIIISGRYIIITMGIFSIYSGLLFNEAFSRSINIFGSMWRLPTNSSKSVNIGYLKNLVDKNVSKAIELDPKEFAQSPYLFGLDPIWAISENYVAVANGFKMKFSVIVGVFHMLFGLMISLTNYIYHKDTIGIIGEFIPEVIFFCSIFGYLVVMIFYKWIFISIHSKHQPSILLALIGMFLSFGKKIPPENLLYKNQLYVEMSLVTVAVISVPWMLLFKPIALYISKNTQISSRIFCYMRGILSGHYGYVPLSTNSRSKNMLSSHAMDDISITEDQHSYRIFESSDQTNNNNSSTLPTGKLVDIDVESNTLMETDHDTDTINVSHMAFHKRQRANNSLYENSSEHESDSFGENLVIQAIHTIEFVLGSVSNTASYLRLWALKLSDVLWSMLLRIGFQSNINYIGPILLAIFFFSFIVLTFFVLVLMEGLSAFLHTLRLHWVEFQGKFYSGSGYAFRPLDLSNVLKLSS